MSVMAGFDDLKPKDVLVFNADGTILVVIKDKVERFQLQLQPTGCLSARPIVKEQPADQQPSRRVLSREQRLAMTDQGQALLGG